MLALQRVVNGNQDVFTLPLAGGPEKRLTDHPAQDGLPRFTHDGRRLLFTSNRSGSFQIWEVAAEGGAARRVRVNTATEWQVDESPDGKRLAFLSNQDGPEKLWISDRDGSHARALVTHGRKTIFGNPDWSGDGRLVLFSSNHRVGHHPYVVDAGTGEERRLGPLTRGGCEPRFHPDGRRFAYTSRGHLSETSRIVEADLETEEEKVLVDWPALNYDVAYAPDGQEIAFASNITGEYQVYRLRLADGKSWRVSFGPGEARYPDYRP